MSTCSGRSYQSKHAISEELQEALKAPIEDRKKRKEEIFAEKATREREIEAERRAKQEEERERERYINEKNEWMPCKHTETLLKIVEARSKEEGPKPTELGCVNLVPLSVKDDIKTCITA